MRLQKFLFPLFLTLSCALPHAANATSAMECWGVDSDSNVRILFGAGSVLNINSASFEFNDSKVSTIQNQETQLGVVAQFHSNLHQLRIELLDDQADKTLVSMHVVRSEKQDGDIFQIGFLRIGQNDPVGIRCDGP